MGDEGVFATTAEVQNKAGANASATANVESYINDFIAQAESQINADVTYNFSDVYATLNADIRDILKLAASNLAAMYVINFDMSGFTSRLEAQTMLDVLWNGYQNAIKVLKEKNKQSFINKA